MLVNNYREPLRRRPVGAQRLLRFRLVNREYWLFHGRPRHIASNQSPSAFYESRDSLPLDHTRTKGWRTWELVRLINRVTLAAISFDLRQALWLGLRVADRLGEHLAQLSLRLRRFSRKGFLPLGHRQYVGMLEVELNQPPSLLGAFLAIRAARSFWTPDICLHPAHIK